MAEPDTKTRSEEPAGWVRWVTRIALVAGAAGLIVTVWLVGPWTILGHLRSIGWWFVLLVAIDVTMTFLDSAAIYTLMKGKERPQFRHVLIAMIAGRSVNVVTPSGNLGEPLKASLLSTHASTPRAVAAVLYMGIASACISLSMIAIGAPLTTLLLPLPPGVDVALYVTGAIAAVVTVTLVVLVRRGMLASLVRFGAAVRIISKKRQNKWREKLKEIDARMSGSAEPGVRRNATLFILVSKSLGWLATWLTVAAAGHYLTAAQLTALLSAGIALTWVGTIVPMQLGVAEGGNYGLFDLIGVAPALGVSLALARRVTQIVYATVGFSVLGISKLFDKRVANALRRATSRVTSRKKSKSKSKKKKGATTSARDGSAPPPSASQPYVAREPRAP